KASNTDANQFCLGNTRVCRLGCVEFIYTSVSRVDTLSLVTTADAAFIFARPDNYHLRWRFTSKPNDVRSIPRLSLSAEPLVPSHSWSLFKNAHDPASL